MTLRHYEVFLKVYDEGSMSAAARVLNVAQPAVTQTIKELETGLGVLLFERLARRLRATEAAVELEPGARRLIAAREELESTLASMGKAPRLRLGASATVGSYLMPGIAKALLGSWPEIRLSVRIDNTATIESLILRDDLDAALVEGSLKSDAIASRAVLVDELVIVARADDPLAEGGPLEPERLRGRSFAVREPGSGTRELFASAMERAGLPWVEAWTCSDSGAILNVVAEGLALAAVPRCALARAPGLVVPLEAPFLRLERDFSIIRHKDKFEGEAMAAFEAAVSRYLSTART